MRTSASLLLTTTLAAIAALSELQAPSTVIELSGDTKHVQGIVVREDASRLWVTSVDVPNKRGLLFEYQLPSGKLIRTVDVQDGDRYHAGGLSGDRSSLWIPVAEYRKASTSIIQKRSTRTLELESSFRVEDHIGCIAITPGEVVGGNWDSRDLYIWTYGGKLVRKVPNPTNNAFQDLKFVNGQLVGSGLLPDKSGAVDFLEVPGLKPVRRILAGRTDRGVAYTHEGMAMVRNRMWLLPEDSHSRLFGFDLK